MKKTIVLVVSFLAGVLGYSQTSADRSLDVRVTSTASPLSFILRWKKGLNAQSYSVSRKSRKDSSWTLLTNSLGVNDTFFVDNTVTTGIGYEYNIKATSSIAPFTAYSYVYCADKLPVKHRQGKIILLIDSNYISSLATEIRRLENDLISEGWSIIRKNIGRNQSKLSVKQFIVSSYLSDTINVKGIFILGHIAVPYSGFIAPDGHAEHEGAWPTDAYYCDTSFTHWTDTIVNDITASRVENKNIPGDGKFDQDYVNPNFHKLFSGRVDLFNMPAINSNDTFLIKQYLDKDHVYRTGQKKFRMKGLIADGFGYFGDEAFAQNGWRNFNTLLTSDSVFTGSYESDMITNSYLWSYGCGGGSYQGAGGISSTSALQNLDLQSVFTMLFGSYFGDWDNQNNFLRAPLASKSSFLVNCWAGRPNWFFHHMAMGEPIGLDAFESCINRPTYLPTGYGRQMIHATLLGDPTLKMYLFEPPTNLVAATINNNSGAKLTWTPSTASGILGYYIYRSNSLTDTFTLITPNYIIGSTYNDNNPPLGKNIYMVRAVKLQNSTTGSFYNLSTGMIDSVTILSTVPITINYFKGEKTSIGNKLNWSVNCLSNSSRIILQKSIDAERFDDTYLVDASANNCLQPFAFTDLQSQFSTNFYRLKLIEIDGKVSYSSIVAIDNSKNKIIDITPPTLMNDKIIFNATTSEKNQLTINITGVSGKLIKVNLINLFPGDNQIKIDCNRLAAGIYNIGCFAGNKQLHGSRFVKQ